MPHSRSSPPLCPNLLGAAASPRPPTSRRRRPLSSHPARGWPPERGRLLMPRTLARGSLHFLTPRPDPGEGRALHRFIYIGRVYCLCGCRLRAPRKRNPPSFFLSFFFFAVVVLPLGVSLQVLRAGLLPTPLAATAPSSPREAGGEQNGC